MGVFTIDWVHTIYFFNKKDDPQHTTFANKNLIFTLFIHNFYIKPSIQC